MGNFEFTFLCVIIQMIKPLCIGYHQYSNSITASNSEPEITSLHIRSDIIYRFATTCVVSTIVNDAMFGRETTFDVTLPDAAFISNFTLEVRGKSYQGIIQEKEIARKQYEQAKRKGQTAGHIATRPRDTNRFKVSINVAAISEVTFKLQYNELLQRRRGSYDHTIYINPKQIVPNLVVEVVIQESREITLLFVPPLRNDILSSWDDTGRNNLATIRRPSKTSAYIKYTPSTEEQRRTSYQGLSGLFVVEYDVDRKMDAGDIMVVNGYFVHFFAPRGLSRLRRRILFILDTSGSMDGTKIQQLKSAMKEILDDLQDGDVFNIVQFSGNVSTWAPDVPARPVTPESIRSAKSFINGLTAEGWTNINSAILEGLRLITTNITSGSGPIIIFLTDGEPTEGETERSAILDNIKTANIFGVPIFSLSFGESADLKFLKKMSAQNNGFARKIYEASDATLQLTGFYDEVSSILMSNVTFRYLDERIIKHSMTNIIFPNYFEGSELVVAGQINDESLESLKLSVVGSGPNGVVELNSTGNIILHEMQGEPGIPKPYSFAMITEKLWAYMTIKQILNERLRETNQTIKNLMKERATSLALKYNFVTPLTSMVVTLPEGQQMSNNVLDTYEQQANDEPASPWDTEPTSPWDKSILAPLAALSSKPPSFVDNDPHFIVNVKGLDTAVCFDVMGKQGDIFNLLFDDVAGILVNAEVISEKVKKTNKRVTKMNKTSNYTKGGNETNDTSYEIKTYLGKIIIKSSSFRLIISPYRWKFNKVKKSWRGSQTISARKTKIVIDGTGRVLLVMFPNKITLLVIRHMRTKSQLQSGKVNFLGFYIADDRGFSMNTHGLLGQFIYRRVVLEKKRKMSEGKIRGRLVIDGNTKKTRKVVATLGKRRNLSTDKLIHCWMVQNNGKRLIDGNYTDYLMESLYSTKTNRRHIRRQHV